MDSEDMDFDPDWLLADWIGSTDWESTIWENRNHDLVDIRTISRSYAEHLQEYINRHLESGESFGLISHKRVMEIHTSRFWEELEKSANS